ncbi:MAG: efflux RND transporter permease subunit [Bacteroidales bacterium]|nr:efflux RND transporter permease subunit [Bacteroidales bacterium]MDD3702513.1 efflux RND transporter permease subunit [Bacteroidales bacterium]MDY0369570.1 efflux RND transporter permease subunit [Bacteroidales bacterium]
MVEFLIKRPVGVLASLIAIIVMGIVAVFNMPVSLLPELDVPEITIHLQQADIDARRLENSVVAPIRTQLAQLNSLHTIESTTRDGSATINLRFKHGTQIQYAYLETNEIVDAFANRLPPDMERPVVLKSSPTDIPVFYLHITPTKQITEKTDGFLELSEFAVQIIKRRLEQLTDVSFVDINGLEQAEIALYTNESKMKAVGVSHEDIATTLEINNITIGSLLIQDGQYQYHVRIGNTIRNADDIKELLLVKNNRHYSLSEFVQINRQPKNKEGFNIFMGNQSITMTVYKQADARMQEMQAQVKSVIAELTDEHPDLQFEIGRNQATLLKVSLENLQQSLLLGIVFSVVIVFGFMRSRKQPVLIALTLPVSLIIAVFFLFLAGVSINTISLAGLILGVGMMIDNSIIVTDNINQWRERGSTVDEACVSGTNEVIRPLISSTLTTCAVFIPLVFLSGIAGELFYEQAIAVTLSLTSSLLISIMVLPVLYRAVYKGQTTQTTSERSVEKWYEYILVLVMNNRLLTVFLFASAIPLGYFTFFGINKETFPRVTQTEVIVKIDWNEPITIFENKERTINLVSNLQTPVINHEMFIGTQQFVFLKGIRPKQNESEIYFRLAEATDLPAIIDELVTIFKESYPLADLTFKPSENIFDMVFSQNPTSLTARFRPLEEKPLGIKDVNYIASSADKIPFRNQVKVNIGTIIAIYPDFAKIALYDVDFEALISQLELLFGKKHISTIKEAGNALPIVFASTSGAFTDKIASAFVTNKQGRQIPLSAILEYKKETELKSIMADRHGEYVAIDFDADYSDFRQLINTANTAFDELSKDLRLTWHGALFDGLDILNELLIVLLISFLLLFFILAAQFESLSQPLIVLSELVFSTAGALLLLWIFNNSLNIMSMIGIIVVSGITINDSILKIDTINRLRKQGYKIKDVILESGKRRFKPIMMTSLTTILALVPLLFIKGMGSDLQLPLALSVIGGLTIGTLVSLYLIPIFYYYLYKD